MVQPSQYWGGWTTVTQTVSYCMGVTTGDDITAPDFETLLDKSADAVRYDNTTGTPLAVRERGNSYVQTLPNGGCRVLTLNEGMTPDIYLHPQANAITFVYE
jgi:hypothetical protein